MDTYRKRRDRRSGAWTFLAILGVFAFTVCLFVGLFYFYGRDTSTVSLQKEYYFLVRDCEDTTASAVAGQVYLAGGAGYLLEEAGSSAVVLSCYFRETDAERVQNMMAEKGIETRLVALKTEDFSLGKEATKFRERIKGNAETVETCAKILYETANDLERAAMTQNEARAAVRGVVTSLKGLRQGNSDEVFALWNARLKEGERRGTEIAEGIIYCKDLRYLEVELLLAILKSDRCFA